MKGKALRRALESSDALRVGADVPLIVDTTELISPETAQAMLTRNKSNRPINWKKVEEYAAVMARGAWALHAQGIILDTDGNILTGQKRLWAVVYSGVNVYMRVSRGNPPATATLIDRGTPQSARDLASRGTGKKHSPTEASIARGVCVLAGNLRPSLDTLAATIERLSPIVEPLLVETAGTKKTKSVLMILAAICGTGRTEADARTLAKQTELLAGRLDRALEPQTSAACWGRGAAFGLAMENARRIVEAAAP